MLEGLFIILGCGSTAWGLLEQGKLRCRLVQLGLLLLAVGMIGASI
jgi:hypothetical protein